MHHIHVIQEIVDAHKEQMPTGAVSAVMAECQKAYEAPKLKLYKLTWTTVDSHAHIERCEDQENFAAVKLSHQTQTLIVEAVEGLEVKIGINPPAWRNRPQMAAWNHTVAVSSEQKRHQECPWSKFAPKMSRQSATESTSSATPM